MNNHKNLLNKIMLELQKQHLKELVIAPRSVGYGYFKRGNRYFGPYKIGNKGDSDIYGSYMITINGIKLAISFGIEVKSGKAVLSSEQKNRIKYSELRGVKSFIGRDDLKVLKEFKEWTEQLNEIDRKSN